MDNIEMLDEFSKAMNVTVDQKFLTKSLLYSQDNNLLSKNKKLPLQKTTVLT